MIPCHIILLFGSDYDQLAYAPKDVLFAEVQKLGAGMAAWLGRETGYTRVFNVRQHTTPLTTLQLGSNRGTSDGAFLDHVGPPKHTPIMPLDKLMLPTWGQGVHPNIVLEDVVYGEKLVPFRESGDPPLRSQTPRNWRFLIVPNAGGYAGGNWGGPEKDGPTANDSGQCTVGDWGLRYAVTGKYDPGAFAQYGDGSGRCGLCGADWMGTAMHEICNGLGIHPYEQADAEAVPNAKPNVNPANPSKYIGSFNDHMSDVQRGNFLRRNTGYLVPTPELVGHIASRFNVKRGQPRYHAAYDLYGNGKIDAKDKAMARKLLGV